MSAEAVPHPPEDLGPTPAVAGAAARSRASDFVALTKPRLNLLVVATTAGGFYMGMGPGFDVLALVQVTAATALVAGGSAAFTPVLARRVDALLARPRRRPAAAARLGTREALAFATQLSLAGLAWLALSTTWLAAGVALVTLLSYVVVYTPMKQRSSFATVVGAVPGALPPMIGWAAATDTLSREAWVLFAIIFLWQMPHFLAIAWLFKDDYGRAGFPMLPVVEPDGRSTGYQVAAYASALLPVSLVPSLMGLTGPAYFVVALALGLVFLGLSLRFAVRRTRKDARTLFFISIAYLPLVWLAMVLDRA
jgi:protoheme IX farnesyltransferase